MGGEGGQRHMVSFRGMHARQDLEDSVYFYFRFTVSSSTQGKTDTCCIAITQTQSQYFVSHRDHEMLEVSSGIVVHAS